MLAKFQGRGEINATAPELGPTTVRFTVSGDPKAINLGDLQVLSLIHILLN